MPAWLPVHSARGLEEFVSALEFLREHDPLTPAALARIAWLFESDRREWCRLVCEHYPEDSDLQAAAEAIKAVPDDCWPESFAGWETAPSPRDILELETQIISANPDTHEKHIHRFKRREEALAVAYSGRELERVMQRERARQQAQALQAEQEVQRLQEEYAQERAKDQKIASLQTRLEHLKAMQQEEYTQMIASAAQQALKQALQLESAPASNNQAKPHRARQSDLPPTALRTPQAARYLGIKDRLLIKLRDKGEIPCIRIGGAVCYLVADLDEYLSWNRNLP